MIKLLIADDERVIRETISKLIDWESLGINLIGLAQNGLEAYNMIIDESPDIVLTDIKMPGLTGLELIQKIHEINRKTQFVILSGYSEFEYAKTAMQYGVRHYILKPCNEEQIITSIKEIIQELSKQAAFEKVEEEKQLLLTNMYSNYILNIINDSLVVDSNSDQMYLPIYKRYSKFLDLTYSSYEIFYLYFLEKEHLNESINRLETFRLTNSPAILYSYIYVKNTLIFFFKSYRTSYEEINLLLTNLEFTNQGTETIYKHYSCKNLQTLLDQLLPKITRYETIYYSNGDSITTICNYQNIISVMKSCSLQLFSSDKDQADATYESIVEVLSTVTDINLLKQLTSSIIIQSSSKSLIYDSVSATEFMIKVGRLESCYDIRSLLFAEL